MLIVLFKLFILSFVLNKLTKLVLELREIVFLAVDFSCAILWNIFLVVMRIKCGAYDSINRSQLLLLLPEFFLFALQKIDFHPLLLNILLFSGKILHLNFKTSR
jgi:hypothetical protein